MRGIVVSILVLIAASASSAAGIECRCFAPTAQQVTRFEERITDLPEPTYHYARYYAGLWLPPVTFRGETVIPSRIQAQFLPLKPGEESAIHIVGGGRLPPLRGEGCVASLDDPPLNDAFQIYARCNEPGGWTPGTQDIADLERRLALPKGAGPLNRYARHYAGVTESGIRLIRGVLVNSPTSSPGIFVGSEIELPLVAEDACNAIDVAYNPETKLSSASCHVTD